MNETPKQRMLNAYRGIWSDRYPVAPEFWYYYPARVLGVDMIEFEREIPLWKALQVTFKKYETEGWGIVSAPGQQPSVSTKSSFTKLSEKEYRLSSTTSFKSKKFHSVRVYHKDEPSWAVEYPVKDEADVPLYLEMLLSPEVTFNFALSTKAHNTVGGDYLLELWLGVPFFDFMAEFMGFEKTLYYFMSEDQNTLEDFQQKYTEFQLRFIKQACTHTIFESFCVGCSYSCNSLLGPKLWRQWDKPYLKAVAREAHNHGKLLHVHFHGKCMETVADFAEIGIDCVCPFERPPGGDVDGINGLKKVRRILGGKVTVNGNVHTVDTLIRGTPEKVIGEVQEIKEAFAKEPRMIIGTGDQVGKETPEENIMAMIQAAKEGL